PASDLHDMLADRDPLAPITTYRFSANRRRHFDRLPRFPEGYLVLGDAACSLNPIYAQGMSVALREARALDQCLGGGERNLARRFFRHLRTITESQWTIATGEDLRFPAVEGIRRRG